MFGHQNATTQANVLLSQARQHFRHLKLDLPAGLTADLAAIDAKTANRQFLRFDPDQLTAAVAAVLDNGKDPALDKNVLTLLARRQLADLAPALDAVLEQRRTDAVHRHAADILEALRPLVEDADATLHEARTAIPHLDLTATDFITTLRPEQMGLWGRAREAVGNLERVTQLWSIAAPLLIGTALHRNAAPLVIADLTVAQLQALPIGPTSRSAITAVHAGHRLNLATPDVYRERLHNYELGVEEAERLFEARRTEAGRRVLAGL